MKRILNGLVSGLIAVSLAFPAGVIAQTPAPQDAAPPASPQGERSVSQEELDQLLAPVALYPDSLLAQILMASTYPLEVVEAARWSKANPNVKDKALEDAMQQQPWDPSVKSLTAFPQVLTMMNEKLDWTQKLGDAFLAQQEDVMGTVQNLRAKAQQQGNLQDTPQQKVIVEKQTTETIIKIEPADPQVVYVPTYNPTVVYGAWWYPAYPPYYYYPPGYVAGSVFWFGVGVAVGSALWGNCNWYGRHVNVNVNRYNSFNRTNITNVNWNHNVNHRKGVAYRDQRVAQQYNRGIDRDAARNREQFRGRAESGRQELGQQFDRSGDRARDRAGDRGPGAAGDRGTRDLGGADRSRDRTGPGAGDRGTRDLGGAERDRSRDRAGAGGGDRGTRDLGGADRSRDMTRPGGADRGAAAGGSRDVSRGGGAPGGGSRDFSGTRKSSGFDGASQGRQARDYSSRGQASRQSMGGGGGARGGGGGGRGGGGRGR